MSDIKVTLKITITENYQLKVSIIDSNSKKTMISLNKDQTIFVPSIGFEVNTISVCENKENDVHFMKDWFEHPEDYKLYSIVFRQREYQLISEILFILIIDKFIQIIEKKWIIENTEIILPSTNEKFLMRISIALDSMNLKGIEFQDDVDYDYEEQNDLLFQILDEKNDAEKYRKLIERARKFSTRKQKQTLEEMEKSIISKDTFTSKINQFTTQQRTKMKLCSLDNYQIFIASKYFETFEDHVNLTKVNSKFKLNMEKFHYNPISMTEKLLEYFPNVETLHLYEKDNLIFTGKRIQQYVDWNLRDFSHAQTIKQFLQTYNIHSENIEFKNIDFRCYDFMNYKKEFYPDSKTKIFEIEIPLGVTKIENIFSRWMDYSMTISEVKKIVFPTTLKMISNDCLINCYHLTNLTIPLNETRVLCGSFLINNKPRLNETIELPTSIKIINGKEVNYTSLTIPSYVTFIEKRFTQKLRNRLEELILPENWSSIPHNMLESLITSNKLTHISISSHFPIYQEGLINDCNNILGFVPFSTNLKRINEKNIDTYEHLHSFTIPLHITSIKDNCFKDCKTLTELNNLNYVEHISYNFTKNVPWLVDKYPRLLYIKYNHFKYGSDIDNDYYDFSDEYDYYDDYSDEFDIDQFDNNHFDSDDIIGGTNQYYTF